MKIYEEGFKRSYVNMKQFFEEAIENHLNFIKRVQDANPLWLLMLEDGGVNIYCIVNEKEESPMQKIKTLIEQKNPDAYLFFALGWAKSLTREKEGLQKFLETYKYGTIKDMPDKKEVLSIIGRTRDGRTEIQKLFNIKRDSNDGITNFQEDNAGKFGKFEVNLP